MAENEPPGTSTVEPFSHSRQISEMHHFIQGGKEIDCFLGLLLQRAALTHLSSPASVVKMGKLSVSSSVLNQH